jgi:hypothetical protein
MKREIVFGIYDPTSKDAKAIIEDGKCIKIKLLIKVPRGYYYHYMNDAGSAFDEQYPQYN